MTRSPIDQNFPPTRPAVKRHPQTGPCTPEGKAVSSQNALQHGCRSAKTLLNDEDPAEFESLVACWFEHYQPQSPVETSLVEQIARAHWFLKRAEKRLEAVEWDLPSNPSAWSDVHHRLFASFSRYKTAAERTFFRFFREAEGQCDKHLKARAAAEQDRLRVAALEIKWLSKKEAAVAAELKEFQWIDVKTVAGRCQTTFFPTNEKLQALIDAKSPRTCFIQRIFSFDNGVPPEYGWAFPDEVQQITDTLGVQKVDYFEWLKVIEKEKDDPTGHASSISFLSFEDDH